VAIAQAVAATAAATVQVVAATVVAVAAVTKLCENLKGLEASASRPF
jgi:hypothetical protein